MSYGLNINNNSGETFFSTEYASLHFVNKYTLTTTITGNATVWYITISLTSFPLVFIKPTGDYVCVPTIIDNSNGTFTIYVGSRSASNPIIYVFAKPNTPSGLNYGIAAWNASGNPTLNTNQKLLKIDAFHVTTGSSGNSLVTPSQTLTYGTVPASYAVGSPFLGPKFIPVGGGAPAIGTGIGVTASGTVVNFGGAYSIAGYTSGPLSTFYVLMGNQYIMFINSTLYD
jgi:hypothetical protein